MVFLGFWFLIEFADDLIGVFGGVDMVAAMVWWDSYFVMGGAEEVIDGSEIQKLEAKMRG